MYKQKNNLPSWGTRKMDIDKIECKLDGVCCGETGSWGGDQGGACGGGSLAGYAVLKGVHGHGRSH